MGYVASISNGETNALRKKEVRQAGVGVEQVGDKGQVQFGVALHNRTSSDVFAAAQLFSVHEHGLGTFVEVTDLQTSAVAEVGLELVQQHSVAFRVLDVARKVVDAFRDTCLPQMVVDPSQQDLVSGELQKGVQRLALFQQADQFRVVQQVDLGVETNLDDLPDETEHQVGSTLDQILGTNVDHTAANRLR